MLRFFEAQVSRSLYLNNFFEQRMLHYLLCNGLDTLYLGAVSHQIIKRSYSQEAVPSLFHFSLSEIVLMLKAFYIFFFYEIISSGFSDLSQFFSTSGFLPGNNTAILIEM